MFFLAPKARKVVLMFQSIEFSLTKTEFESAKVARTEI